MKRLAWILVLSLTLNAALAAIWWQATRPAPARGLRAETAPAEPSSSADSAAVTPTADTAGVGSRLPIDSDPDALVAALRAAGYPRSLIARALNHLLLEKRQATEELAEEAVDAAWWKSRVRFYDARRSCEEATKTQEHAATMARLIGPDYLAEFPEQMVSLQRAFGPLPPEKLLQMMGWGHERAARYAETAEATPPTEREQRQRELEEEIRARIAQLLTPAELQEYDLRNSRTAHQMRSQYEAARLSEAEYRQLFALMRPLEDQLMLAPGAGTTPAFFEARRQAQEQVQRQLELAFGRQRAAELAQAADGSARQENQLVARLGLPISAATEVVAIRKDVQQRAAQVQRDGNLTAEQRQEQLRGLHDDATRRITGALGERGMSAYREFGGQWMKRLTATGPAPTTQADDFRPW